MNPILGEKSREITWIKFYFWGVWKPLVRKTIQTISLIWLLFSHTKMKQEFRRSSFKVKCVIPMPSLKFWLWQHILIYKKLKQFRCTIMMYRKRKFHHSLTMPNNQFRLWHWHLWWWWRWWIPQTKSFN